jgi:RNA 3'-terminal phosphate cyclase (ATP)
VLSREKGEIDVMNPIRIGADALGERGKRAEAVGVEAAKRLIEELSTGCCVDRHLADSLIPYLGLAGGEMTVSEITEHTRTNIMVAEMFLKQRFTTPEGNRIITIAARA